MVRATRFAQVTDRVRLTVLPPAASGLYLIVHSYVARRRSPYRATSWFAPHTLTICYQVGVRAFYAHTSDIATHTAHCAACRFCCTCSACWFAICISLTSRRSQHFSRSAALMVQQVVYILTVLVSCVGSRAYAAATPERFGFRRIYGCKPRASPRTTCAQQRFCACLYSGSAMPWHATHD